MDTCAATETSRVRSSSYGRPTGAGRRLGIGLYACLRSWHDAQVSDPLSIGLASRAWYHDTLDRFRATLPDAILGRLVANSAFAVLENQRDAWRAEIAFLQDSLAGLSGSLFLEFSIPRMGRRIDAVLLIGPVVFVVEFKVGATNFDAAAIDQVWDYALDLKNFHGASHPLPIVPILVATEASTVSVPPPRTDADGVYRPIAVDRSAFRAAIDLVFEGSSGEPVDAQQWLAAPYLPTPTIVEAARALYAQHSVEAIARHDAGAENLRVTSQHIEELIAEAKRAKRKVVCFVTGVPGAGKTLVGLNVATRRRDADAAAPAVYLSGNGPLVAVLRAALTRDEIARQKALGNQVRRGKVGESVKAFIQNVHHFRDEAIIDSGPPAEHVAIFDEAQRAWTLKQTAYFMRRKKNLPDFSQSEPEFLVSYMDRHADWSVVVCLVGGGQEINIGEAGIDSWLQAIQSKFPGWRMHISSRLTDAEYAAGHALDTVRSRPDTFFDDCLHLSVSMRSFRAENVSAFVKALLDRDVRTAAATYEQFADRYPIAITRDIEAAKAWVRRRARGSERYGLVASSKAMRLKPHAIDVRVDVDPVHWFLNDKDDTRSSYYLEDAATEFQVQGLELDWSCVTWDADLRFHDDRWGFHDFRGSKWTNVKHADNQRYLLNAYRVLLTRARQGMVIFVPPGNTADHTRPREYYDATFGYLAKVGLPTVA
ncbi:MAG: DUF2075 domain-containing protein [Polyangiaceae bacterium]|nr:DUF2075 domain-containing protein [Polyangiaceae bacterium]